MTQEEQVQYISLIVVSGKLSIPFLINAAGTVLDSGAFDTHGDNTAGNRLRDYLNSINGKYVSGTMLYMYSS